MYLIQLKIVKKHAYIQKKQSIITIFILSSNLFIHRDLYTICFFFVIIILIIRKKNNIIIYVCVII